MHKANSHNHQSMEIWFGETLTEKEITPIGGVLEKDVRERKDDETRALKTANGPPKSVPKRLSSAGKLLMRRVYLHRACVGPLIEQASGHSLKLGELLERVWEAQEKLIEEAVQKFENQQQVTEKLKGEMNRLLDFSERQLLRGNARTDKAKLMEEHTKRNLRAKEISIKLLETTCSNIEARQREFEDLYAQTVEDVEGTASIIKPIENNLSNSIQSMNDATLSQLKWMDDLDRLVGQMERNSLEQRRRELDQKEGKIEKETVSIQTESSLEVSKRGDLSNNGYEEDLPPLTHPNKWRIGWGIPFELRNLMTSFKSSKRVMEIQKVKSIIIEIYQGMVDSMNSKSKDENAALNPAIATHSYFSNVHGIQKLVDWGITEFLNSIKYYKKEDKGIELFGRLLGLFHFECIQAVGILPGQCCYVDTETRKCRNCISMECITFIISTIKKLIEKGQLQLEPNQSDLYINLDDVMMTVSNLRTTSWRLFTADDITDTLSEVPVKDISTISSNTEEKNGSSVPMVIFDDMMAALVRLYEKADERWGNRIKQSFIKHATVYRHIHGVTIPCKNVDLNGNELFQNRQDAISGESKNNHNQAENDNSYFGFLEEAGYIQAVKKGGTSLSKKQQTSVFQKAKKIQKEYLSRRSKLIWIEEKCKNSRTFYINQFTNERVWDEMPMSMSQFEELRTPNPMKEVDFQTFSKHCHTSKWWLFECK